MHPFCLLHGSTLPAPQVMDGQFKQAGHPSNNFLQGLWLGKVQAVELNYALRSTIRKSFYDVFIASVGD